MKFGKENINRSPDITDPAGHVDNKKTTSVPAGGFRCPFEIKGDKDGTIVEARFNDDKATRLQLIKASLDYFYKNENSSAIKFKLPPSLREEVNSNEELKLAILPFQTEILASELDYRLSPFLPYQLKQNTREVAYALAQKEPYKFLSSNIFSKVIKDHGFPLENINDLNTWIYSIMKPEIEKGVASPHLFIKDFGENNQEIQLLTITPGSIRFHPEDYENITGQGKNNKNLFGIVRSPFYPKEFGRYSEDVEIVLTRMKDFGTLPIEVSEKIREKSNAVYKSHGVEIQDVTRDQQHEGLWIPEYKNDKI